MLREAGAIGLTAAVLAPAAFGQEPHSARPHRINHSTPHLILANPTSLPNYGDLITNDDFAELESTAVGIYERPKGSTGPFSAICSGNIVDVSAGSGQPAQKDVLTAEHCFSTPEQEIAQSASAVNIAGLEPYEYSVSMPQYPGGFGYNVGLVTGISIIVNSGDPKTPQPDAALLSVQPEDIPQGVDPYDQAAALTLTPQLRPKPGEQVASFAFPFGAGATTGTAGVDVYLGRINTTFTTPTGSRRETVDVVGSQVTNPLFDPHQFGTSGHLEKTASGVVLGPDDGRTGVIGENEPADEGNPPLDVARQERRSIERRLRLNLSMFNVIELKTVLTSLNV